MTKFKSKPLNIAPLKVVLNNRGISMVEVLIASVVLGILAMGMTVIMGNFNRSLKASEEKLTVLELKKSLMTVAAGKNICAKDITDFPTKYQTLTPSFPPASIDVEGIYLSSSDPQPLAKINESIMGQTTLKAKSIKIDSINGATSPYIAKLTIEFIPGTVARKPISLFVNIHTTVVGSNTHITGCVVPEGGGTLANYNVDQAACVANGGMWVAPPAPRPAFCHMPGDSVEWY